MIIADFTTGASELTVEGLTQWDLGQELKLVTEYTTQAFQVHFANIRSKDALVVEATFSEGAAVVPIPNLLLQEPHWIRAWVYLKDDNKGETVLEVLLPVKERKKPSDYIYTEVEMRTLEQAAELAAAQAVTEATSKAASYALSAEEFSNRALGHSSTAQEAAQTASGAADDAQDAAAEAEDAATAAANSAAAAATEAAKIVTPAFWLTVDTYESAAMDGVLLSHLTGGTSASENTVHVGDLLITSDGVAMSVVGVTSSTVYVGGGTSLVGPAGEGVTTEQVVVTVGASGCDFNCDGVADDVQIQAAIDSLPDTGGVVYFKHSRDYYLSKPLTISKANVLLTGAYTLSSDLAATIHSAGAVLDPAGMNLTVAGLVFVGDSGAETATAITLTNASGSVVLANCVFSGWKTVINQGSASVPAILTVEGCKFADGTNAIYGIKNGHVVNSSFAGYSAAIAAPQRSRIAGNVLTDNGIGISVGMSGGNTITGNHIKRGSGKAADYTTAQHTILLGEDFAGARYGKNNTVSGNFLHGKGLTIYDQTGAAAAQLANLATNITGNFVVGDAGAITVGD